MRQATKAEQRWWKRLAWLMSEIPDTLEIVVHYDGSITAHERGAMRNQCDTVGHGDNVPTLPGLSPEIIDWTEGSVIAHSEDA
jgi:hypothetical protein